MYLQFKFPLAANEGKVWRFRIAIGAKEVETRRLNEVKERRANSAPTLSLLTHRCLTCNRAFRAQIGLISHLRTHRQSVSNYLHPN